MKRYFIYLSYNGANYCGWQTQPNGITVQESIEKALGIILRSPTPILGAGRTDSGVHARMMVAHFDSAETLDKEFVKEKLNRILPWEIAIHRLAEVKSEAHARFDATSRLYRYYVTTEKDPFQHPFKYKIRHQPDLDAMNTCAKLLFEYIDFTSFSKLHTDVKTNNCKIMQAEWMRQGNEYIFTIRANRFLRNMVRSIVGTLLEAGSGKLDAEDMRHIIEAKNRSKAGTSAPGHALFLEDITYPPEIFIL